MTNTKSSKLLNWFVLFCFYFQTLWPSVAFGAGDVETLRPAPLPASSFSSPSPSVKAVAPFTLQAFVDDQMEGFDAIDSKPVVSFPGAASLGEAQDWFDQSLETKSLYPGLVLTEDGVFWTQHGLNFFMSIAGHLAVSSLQDVIPTTKALRLHNFHGDVIFGGDLQLAHVQVQAKNVFQAGSNAVIERLEVWAMGDSSGKDGGFANKENATLTTEHVVFHEGHCVNRGRWNVSEDGVVDLQGHDFVNHETMNLGNKAVLKNQGEFFNIGVVDGDSYTLEIGGGANGGTITGESPTVQVSGDFSNAPDGKIIGKSSLTVSGRGTVDNQGTISSKKALSLENKSITNQGLVYSEWTMRLALQDALTNRGTGNVISLGQGVIEGQAKIHNQASLKETADPAGMVFAGGLHFNGFRGEVVNDGLLTTQSAMTGMLRRLVNNGTFGASLGYQGLTISDFLNEKSGKLLGYGHLILNGKNRGLMQGDWFSIQTDGTFVHEKEGLIQTKSEEKGLETSGNGKFIQQGQIHGPLLALNTSHVETYGSLGNDAIELTIGKSVVGWKNHEKSNLKAQKLTLEQEILSSKRGDFLNEGTLNVGTFINHRSGFANRDQMTLKHWFQYGALFKNEKGGTIDVAESSEAKDVDTLDNEGDINWEGTLNGTVLHFLNKGGVKLKGDAKLEGERLVNLKTFKAFGIFDWLGETLDNSGSMALFDNQIAAKKQILNKGLILWTHNTFRTWHLLNMGWMERTLELTDKENATLTTEHVVFHEGHCVNRGRWNVSEDGVVDLQGHDFVNHETMNLGNKAVLKNQGEFFNIGVVDGDSYTLEIGGGANGGTITGESPTVQVSGDFSNAPDGKIIGKSSLTVSGRGTVDNQGTISSKKALSLENKSITNQGLVYSEWTMRLALQDALTNRGTGNVISLGQGVIEGQAKIHNQASLKETADPAGMVFAGGLHFNGFRGEVVNDGLLTTQSAMTGMLRRLVNNGTFGASLGYQGLTISDFLNEKSGKLLGYGHLILNGKNRGLMQGDWFSIQTDGTFVHEKEGLIQTKSEEKGLETSGNGKFIQQGQIHGPLLALNTSHVETYGSLGNDAIELTIGKSVVGWKNHEKSNLKAQKLTLEQEILSSKRGDFLNEGTLNVGTFINHRSGFANRDQMTLKHWFQYGALFKNEKGGTIDVAESSEAKDVDTLDNEGDINWEGTLNGTVLHFLNKGGVKLKGDAKLEGERLVNLKTFKAFGIFDWLGETLDNSGSMALFDNQIAAKKQILNKGLILWTHNTFRTWHLLNMGWMERTLELTDKGGAISKRHFKVSENQDTTFQKGLVENRGTIKLPVNYKPRMTVKGKKFEHWLNSGTLVLPEKHCDPPDK
jgi:adhesin HecA-like repeat protein